MCTYRACPFTGRDSKWAGTHGNPSLFCLMIVRAQTQIVKTIQRNRGCSWLAWRLAWHPHRYGGGLSWYLSLSFYSISSLVILSEPQALPTSQTERVASPFLWLARLWVFNNSFMVLLPWYLLRLENWCRLQSAFSPRTAGPGFWKWSQSLAQDSAGSECTVKSCWNFLSKLSIKTA